MSIAALVLVTWLSFLAGWAIGFVVFDDSAPRRLTEHERRLIEQAAQEFTGLRSWYSVR